MRNTRRRLILEGGVKDAARILYLALFICVGLRLTPGGAGWERCRYSAAGLPGSAFSCWRCCLRVLALALSSRCPPFCWRLQHQAFWGRRAAALVRALRGMAKDAGLRGALWFLHPAGRPHHAVPVATHVLAHGKNGAYHTGQSCYGDMPMHLGFIKYIAQSGEFLPCAIPYWAASTGSGIRSCADCLRRIFGYGGEIPHGVSSADAARIFVGVRYVLAAGHRMTDSAVKAKCCVLPVLYGQRVRLCVFSRQC